jgi:hypothetical protein
MLSPYSKELKKNLSILSGKVQKLTPNLRPKRDYVVHYRNLKYYLQLGMRVVGFSRVLRFRQSPWMKPYIDANTAKRQAAVSEFEKTQYKNMNNIVFGKSMENVRNYRNIKLAANQRKLDKLVADPRFKELQVFTDDLVAVSLEHDTVTLNKPIYVGFSVLELSKLLMYQFHYGYIKDRFGDRAKLLFTDTDSLCYEFKSPDIYQEIGEDADLFDFSDYPTDHPLHSVQNKKVMGKMKDEMNGMLLSLVSVLLFGGWRPQVFLDFRRSHTRVCGSTG